MQRSDIIQQLYQHTAPHYEAHIAPIMRRFAQNLIQTAQIQATDIALDIGTGTGVLAHEVVGIARRVIGIDISMSMLPVAQALRLTSASRPVHFLLADANTLACLAANCCDVVFASFGLGETDPERSLRAIARVLRPGGRFYAQEWGPYSGVDDPRYILDNTLAEYATEDANELQLAFRQLLAIPNPWEAQLQDTDDYKEALVEAGFADIVVSEARPLTITFNPGIQEFLAYTMAWSPRFLEMAALPPTIRQSFDATIESRLTLLQDNAGFIHWQPTLFRLRGICI